MFYLPQTHLEDISLGNLKDHLSSTLNLFNGKTRYTLKGKLKSRKDKLNIRENILTGEV